MAQNQEMAGLARSAYQGGWSSETRAHGCVRMGVGQLFGEGGFMHDDDSGLGLYECVCRHFNRITVRL
jgi:hypothetical protein